MIYYGHNTPINSVSLNMKVTNVQWQWFLIVALGAGLLETAAILIKQHAQLASIAVSVATISSRLQDVVSERSLEAQPDSAETTGSVESVKLERGQSPSQTLLAENFQIAMEYLLDNDNESIRITHWCKGTMTMLPQQTVRYCIGENVLSIVTRDSSRTLESKLVTTPSDAPVLMKAELIPSTESTTATVLISYSSNACVTTNDCGDGMPNNYVNYAYTLEHEDADLRALVNYPKYGHPTWNSDGTKAVFVKDTCGGAGCTLEPLTGYDLSSDTSTVVTSARAAWTTDGRVGDVLHGTPLAHWEYVSWKTHSSFTATILMPDGKREDVTGSF